MSPIQRSRGFTLAEIAAVIGLITLVIFLGMPSVTQPGYQHSLIYDDVLATVRYARDHAVATRCPVQLQIQTISYRLLRQSTCGTAVYQPTDAFDSPIAHPGEMTDNYEAIYVPDTLVLAPENLYFRGVGDMSTTGVAGASNDVAIPIGNRTIAVVGETGHAYEP